MKKWKLSFILFVVTFSMIVFGTTMNHVTVSAETTDSSDMTFNGFEYSIAEDSSITITGYSGSEKEVVIPSQIDGKPVTRIGERAFYGCTALSSITIPDSVTSIGKGAFYGCTALSSITVPNYITSIESSTFYKCNSLTRITIPNGVTFIDGYAFCYCKNLSSITIPNSVTYIGEFTFGHCYKLATLTLPDNLTSIDKYAFFACDKLDNIVIPNGVISIGADAFNSCDKLTSITIPDSVTSIGDSAISGTIHGIWGSYAQEYAKTNNIPFVCIHIRATDWVSEKDPTCTTTGLKIQNCKDCNEIINSENIPTIDHTYSDWQTETDATCTENGSKYQSCTQCGERKYEDIPAEHTFTDWQIERDAICNRNGIKSRTCTRCQEREQESIPMKGHDYVINTIEPTCKDIGYEVHTCKVCGQVLKYEITHDCPDCSGGTVNVNIKCWRCEGRGHENLTCPKCKGMGELYIKKPCPKANYVHLNGNICSLCNNTRYIDDTILCDTCKGTKKKPCSVCNGKKYRQTSATCSTCQGKGKIPDKGEHNYGNWNITLPATQTTEGEKQRTCTICGVTETKKIPKTDLPDNSNITESTRKTIHPSTTTTLSQAKKITAKNKKKKAVTLSWKKVKNATWYEIQYSTSKKFKPCKKYKVNNTTATIKKLKKKKTYYFRIRAYKMDGKKKVYGKWSATKKVKIIK